MAVARYFVMGCKVVRRREEGTLGEKFGRFMGRVFPSSSLREAENVGSPSSKFPSRGRNRLFGGIAMPLKR